MFPERMKADMASLTGCLYRLYGSRWDFHSVLGELVKIMEDADRYRPKHLRARDEDEHRDWFNSGCEVGMMLYVDLFAGDLGGVERKIPYLQSLGVTYVHLMPLFRCPAENNDGGYAVSSYRDVEPRIGSIEKLAALAASFHKAGIRLVLDFVFNHTSDEHEWALAARRGSAEFSDYYFIYRDKADADAWNRTLREIFPDSRRGSFTWVDEVGGWVWTTFNSFQWDLNYANPAVFLAMCREMLSIANLGVDVLRLDALAFVWKKMGTTCENLPEAHVLIQAFQYVARIAAPSLCFKSEAIVHPDEVIKYIGDDECRLSYNPLQMALFWEASATRSTALLSSSLRKRWSIPASCGWVNYIRCHDDIGWTFSDDDAQECGINGYDHRHFLNRFYMGIFPGSFAKGEPFQFNPATGDCRVCGTMASLSGFEEALALYRRGFDSGDADILSRAELHASMAVARMTMLYASLFALPGIPLLYAGDETATLNDYSYRDVKGKKDDSRWVNRIAADWKRIERIGALAGAPLADASFSAASATSATSATSCVPSGDPAEWLLTRQARVFAALKRIIAVRKAEPAFRGSSVEFVDIGDARVLAFVRRARTENGVSVVRVLANFSEEPVLVHPRARGSAFVHSACAGGNDLLSGEELGRAGAITLAPYQAIWLKEKTYEEM